MQYNTSSDWFVNYLYLAHSSYKCMYEHERACALNEPLIQTYLVSVHDEKPFRSFACIASGGGILWWGIDVKSAWGQYCWGTRLATLDLSTLLFICPKTRTSCSVSVPAHTFHGVIKVVSTAQGSQSHQADSSSSSALLCYVCGPSKKHVTHTPLAWILKQILSCGHLFSYQSRHEIEY